MSDALRIHWPYLVLAVAMLGFPRQWMRSGARVLKRRRKPDGALEQLAGVGARDPTDKSVQVAREFRSFRNFIDLFRAAAGGYGLTVYSFTARSDASADLAFGLQVAVLLVGVLVQAVRVDGGRLSFYAPIFYLVGLSTGFCQHYTGLFAFALVLAVNPIIPNPRVFLTAFGLLLPPLGWVFDTEFRGVLAMAAGVLAIPLLSLLTKRPVVIFSRKPKSASSAAN